MPIMNLTQPRTTTPRTSGGHPLWDFAQERTARAIDDALDMGLDLSDPFAPGWFETDDFGPAARDIQAVRGA